MDELLSGLHEAGRLESSARFSVDVLRAHEMLQRFQLADPGFYLLKLIQAAVSSGAPVVAVRLGRETVEVAFQPTSSFVDLPRLLLEGSPPAGPLHHLIVALTGALALEPRELTFSVTGEFEMRLFQDGLVLGPPPVRPITSCRFWMVKAQSGTRLQRMLGRVRTTLAESAAITERCRFAPVPVKLDGRLVNSPFPEQLPCVLRVDDYPRRQITGANYSVAAEMIIWASLPTPPLAAPTLDQRRPAFLNVGEGWVMTGGRTTLLTMLRGARPGSPFPPSTLPECLAPQDRGRHSYEDHLEPCATGETALRLALLPQNAAYAVVTLPVISDGMGQVIFVADGVQLNPIRVDLGVVGVVAVLANPGLTTDLSEFEVVTDESYQKVVDWVRWQARELAHAVQPHVATWQAADKVFMSDFVRDTLRKRLGGI